MSEASKPTMSDRFVSAYIALGLGAGFLLGATTFTTNTPHRATGLQPISNSTYPENVELHFRGKPLHVFSPTLIQLPEDGVCRDYSNKVSWRVLVCMGSQPESQP